jgi:hypothetical protein
MTVHDRMAPEPSTGTKTKFGSVDRQCGQTTSGGWLNDWQREHRASESTWSAAAAQ